MVDNSLIDLGMVLLLGITQLFVFVFKCSFEWGSINVDDAWFDQCVGTNKFVRCGVVANRKDGGFGWKVYTSPSEVTIQQTESTELIVSTTATNDCDFLWINIFLNLGVGCLHDMNSSVGSWTTHLVVLFLMPWSTETTGRSAFEHFIVSKTHSTRKDVKNWQS